MNIKEYNCNINLLSALLWQDDNTVNLKGLLEAKQSWYQKNHCEFWENWQRDVFDLNTANDFGIRVWSEILNIQLFATNEASPDDFMAFGFDHVGAENFDSGNFATDSNQSFLITTEQRRTLLKLRFFQLITRAAIPEINRFFATIFSNIYALDGNDMTMTYVNLDSLPSELRRAIVELDLLPRPAGVSIDFASTAFDSFGFSDSSTNFDNGNFIGG